MVTTSGAQMCTHTPTHLPTTPAGQCSRTCRGFLESVGRSLQQENGTRIRKRVGPLALYSRALSGCHGVRGLLPEPLCEMRTLQKHSLERDRKSTGACILQREAVSDFRQPAPLLLPVPLVPALPPGPRPPVGPAAAAPSLAASTRGSAGPAHRAWAPGSPRLPPRGSARGAPPAQPPHPVRIQSWGARRGTAAEGTSRGPRAEPATYRVGEEGRRDPGPLRRLAELQLCRHRPAGLHPLPGRAAAGGRGAGLLLGEGSKGRWAPTPPGPPPAEG